MKNIKIIIPVLIVVIIAAVGIGMFFTKSAYEVDLKLTPEQKTEYEANVKQWNQKLQEAIKSPEKPDIDLFIEKARYQEYLGKYGQAIDTLLEAFKYYENTSAGWNNIAKLYDKVGDYESAIIYYNKLISAFRLNRYYLDAAWDYYKLGKLDVAKEAYGRYTQLELQRDDTLYNLLFLKKP